MDLNTKELAILRKALAAYENDLGTDRRSQDEIRLSKLKENADMDVRAIGVNEFMPLPVSEEETVCSDILTQIRAMERTMFNVTRG